MYFVMLGYGFWKDFIAIDNALSITGSLFINSVGSRLSSDGSESEPELSSFLLRSALHFSS